MNRTLGQYYTHEDFSNLIIEKISHYVTPQTVIELGFGEGALLRAVLKKWSNVNYSGIDLDITKTQNLKSKFPSLNLITFNGLDSKLRKGLGVEFESVDVAICNPPFQKLKKEKKYNRILSRGCFIKTLGLKNYTTDLIFFVQNLLFLKPGGMLGIILPDGLISGSSFEFFRQDIIRNVVIKAVYQLPEKSFNKTEARTHVLIVKKESPILERKVSLAKLDKSGKVIGQVFVSQEHLRRRMDFSFHWNQLVLERKGSSFNSVKNLNPVIFRGNYSRKRLLSEQVRHFHTTDFKNECFFEFSDSPLFDQIKFAESGDILFARVGTRLIGKVGFVEKGRLPISDCIIVLRFANYKTAKWVFGELNKNEMKSYIKSFSRGVCARFLTYADILEIKIPKYTTPIT